MLFLILEFQVYVSLIDVTDLFKNTFGFSAHLACLTDLELGIDSDIDLNRQLLLEKMAEDVADAFNFWELYQGIPDVVFDLFLGAHENDLSLFRILLGIDVNQDFVDVSQIVEDVPPHSFGHLVGRGDAHQTVNFQVQIDEQVGAHPAGSDLMKMFDAFHPTEYFTDMIDDILFRYLVCEFADAFITDVHTGLDDQPCHQESCDRIEQGPAELCSSDADQCGDR